MDGVISTGTREMGGGLERYTFQVKLTSIRALAERARGSDAVVKHILAGWYMLSPRPDPRDILSVSIDTNRCEGAATVELVIKRGHYQLLDLVHEHEDLMLKKDGTIRCSCHPGKQWHILRDHLPNYGKEFSDGKDRTDLPEG